MCVPNVIKNITAKVFDLISWKKKTRKLKLQESCKCESRLDPIICNNKQKWNKDKCRCECLVNEKCNKNFTWDPSNCKCKYKKKTAHLLTEECEEIIDNKIVPIEKHNKTLLVKKYNKAVSIKENTLLVSCKPFVASSIFFYLSVINVGAFVYFYGSLQPKRKLQYYYQKSHK